ncbi:hypothetical protein [Variovorax sp. GB1P17]|uniref:hypothetical protein n=1 Tax=Variovorax sp. GB1P17 TaxID=3443740 RepID=UPI003F498796
MDAVPSKRAARTVQACVFVKMKFLVGWVEIDRQVAGSCLAISVHRFSNFKLKTSLSHAEDRMKSIGHAR